MDKINLMPHQIDVLEKSKDLNRVAYFYDMGTGKTYIGSSKMHSLSNRVNLLVCQKSKVKDWLEHFKTYYSEYTIKDLTKNKVFNEGTNGKYIGVVNYDIVYRRDNLKKLQNFTLMLDESSLIANEKTKRSKAILKMGADNVILLSGTPVSGKYEKLYSQCKLLGWNITKKEFYDRYIVTKDFQRPNMPFAIKIVVNYKRVDELKDNLRKHGAFFMKADEIISLPEKNFIIIKCEQIPEYKKFKKDRIVTIDGKEIIGQNTLTKMLGERQLCSQYNRHKLQAFKDLLNDTDDRLIVFYNFTAEKDILTRMVERPMSLVCGETKDLENYEKFDNSITFIQVQAGAKGLNLQKANKIIYFSLPLSAENFMQSQSRIRRIGQKRKCFYYILETENSIDGKILEALNRQEDYTNALFEEQDGSSRK